MSFGPFSAFYFVFYEQFKGLVVNNDAKSYLSKIHQETEADAERAHTQDISFGKSMLCSMLAGSLASTMTNPLDLGKLRM
mmetsp:Transcript_102135/g.141122  ORF Transcript_102135/g.141122 Transcript_102135/m.141122 type:complete len:80 (+) Transcript_102135:540-779(+)